MDTQCTGLIPAHAGKTQVGGLEGLPVPGSSPLTRGKRRSGAGFPVPPGLIPAHAGKTRGTGASRRGAGAHPRSRGENLAEQGWDVPALGSSPLTRGKLAIRRGREVQGGLIPAHAGKTTGRARPAGQRRAHPRSRGENVEPLNRVTVHEGSSPLTRGKLRASRFGGKCKRLIPAHAGKTSPTATWPPPSRAHPRSRGENLHCQYLQEYPLGSSPLTRGKPVPCVPQNAWRGLIPAHAGKTWWSRSGRTCRRAHPRSRGENHSTLRLTSPSLGSSPLTRGKRVYAVRGSLGEGLIPAHAGKTTCRSPRRRRARAHPRSRGENVIVPSFVPTAAGSSPLTRGKRQPARLHDQLGGLIPAHAGKTPKKIRT